MSMSVVAIMSELPKVGSGGGDRRRTVNHQDIAKVRRVLFGPVDHTETRLWLEKEFAQKSARDTDRWEFDFVNEMPRPTKRRYIWSASVEEPKVDPCPAKRPNVEEDISRLYGEPIEEELRPRTQNTRFAEQKSKSTSSKSPANPKQSFITDYMQIRKRQVQSTKKEATSDSNSSNVAKKARLTQQPSAS